MEATIEREPIGYPPELAKFAGRMNDADAHEWTPPELWVEEFGEITRPFAEQEAPHLQKMKKNYFRDVDSDKVDEITHRSAWRTKGPYAPGAHDMAKRVELLDFIGVNRQLVFPGNVAINALFLLGQADQPRFMPDITGDRRKFAYDMIRAQNDWAVRKQGKSDRLRQTAILLGSTPDALYDEAKRLIAGGIRVVWLPVSILPGGKSPAHNDHDRLWDLLADSDTTVTLHVGNETGFFNTLGWKDAEAFEGWLIGEEMSLDPWTLSTLPLPSESFIAAMVTGGVFHRHPKLRFGAIEAGAHWLGPLAHAMDMWAANTQTSKWSERLPLKPSEYVRRNVRVAGFPWEPIDTYIEYYGLTECYCYASDFPHVEGGTDPMGFWSQRLNHLGEDVKERFFVDNAKWLLPD